MTVTRSAFAATLEGEARLLLLIDAFSVGEGTLQGRTKLGSSVSRICAPTRSCSAISS
jgi:hypothetical protein